MKPEAAPGRLNLVEPPQFAALFAQYPPAGFSLPAGAELPAFRTKFDLLTTLEPSVRRRLTGLPLLGRLAAGLKFDTLFAGSSITEYAPLPDGRSPAGLLELFQGDPGKPPFMRIIKDLPWASPLLSERENALADELAAEAARRGFFQVEGQALAYVSIDFASPEEYLARLSAGRRKDLRRKLRARERLELETLPLGHPCFQEPAFLDELYAMYLEVFEQSEIHFDLLPPGFFTALLQSRDIPGRVFFYHCKGEPAGYNICLEYEGRLIDKYIGLRYPLARELNLYFVSWFVNLEYALAAGLKTYIAGWTDPEVKAGLGASFTFTRHLVWVRNPLLRGLLRPLRRFFESDRRALEGKQGGR